MGVTSFLFSGECGTMVLTHKGGRSCEETDFGYYTALGNPVEWM